MKEVALLCLLIMQSINTYSQIDSSAQSFFPCNIGDSWYYKYSQDLGYVTTITRDSIANGNRFLFYDNSSVPSFEIDTLFNVWSNPTTGYRSLQYKLTAKKNERWHVEGTIMAKIDDEYWEYIFTNFTKVKKIGYYSELDTINYSVWFYDRYIAAGFGFYLEITDAMQDPARWLEGCTINGNTYGRMTAVKNIDISHKPAEFILYPAYPNPFNPIAFIRYQLQEKSRIRLTISDMLGKEIAVLVDGEQNKGIHTVTWNASKYSSGVYLCQLKTKWEIQARKIAFIK